MPEIADRLRGLDSAPTFRRLGEDPLGVLDYDVMLPWPELCDFLELAESVDHPAGVSAHEWGVRRAALQEAVRRL